MRPTHRAVENFHGPLDIVSIFFNAQYRFTLSCHICHHVMSWHDAMHDFTSLTSLGKNSGKEGMAWEGCQQSCVVIISSYPMCQQQVNSPAFSLFLHTLCVQQASNFWSSSACRPKGFTSSSSITKTKIDSQYPETC